MPSFKRISPPSAPYRLDADFLPTIFRHRCLAASPHAVNVVDPWVVGSREQAPEIRFVFSDIPDVDFREPSAIIMKSYHTFRRE